MRYGATDDFGFKAVERPVHVHDLHATILYLMGIDHEKLTYRYSGRDFRSTDVHGTVIHDILKAWRPADSRGSEAPRACALDATGSPSRIHMVPGLFCGISDGSAESARHGLTRSRARRSRGR
jgi:hypothetical protein